MQNITTIRRAIVAVPLSALIAVAGFAAPAATAVADGFSASASTLAALGDAQARYSAAVTQLDYLNQQVFEAEGVYNQICADLAATEQAIADLQVLIEQQRIELANAQQVLAERLNANYRAGEAEPIDVLLSAASFDDLVSRIYYLNKVSDADAKAIQDVKDIKAALEANEAALQEQRAYQEELRAQQEAQVAFLNEQVAAVSEYAASLDWEVQQLMAQAQAEAQAAAEAYYAQVQAEAMAAAQAEAAEVIAIAEEAGYTYDEESGAFYDDSGSYVDTSTVSEEIGYVPSGNGLDVSSIISAAYGATGTPYVWGGESAGSALDCSGLTQYAYGTTGTYIPHNSGQQYNEVVSAGNFTSDTSQLNSGDLVFYSGSSGIYHVALYLGDNQVIDAIPNGGVQVRDINYVDGYIGGGSPV